MNMKRYFLGVAAFVVVGFIMAAVWHFVLFGQVYSDLKIYTIEPIIALGFISFVLEGLAFVYVFQLFRRGEKPLLEGLLFGLVVYGIIMGGVGVLAEGAKHYVTSLSTWLLVEGAFYLVTGAILGTIVGLIYGKKKELREKILPAQ
jgi:hypothetical protein